MVFSTPNKRAGISWFGWDYIPITAVSATKIAHVRFVVESGMVLLPVSVSVIPSAVKFARPAPPPLIRTDPMEFSLVVSCRTVWIPDSVTRRPNRSLALQGDAIHLGAIRSRVSSYLPECRQGDRPLPGTDCRRHRRLAPRPWPQDPGMRAASIVRRLSNSAGIFCGFDGIG